MDVVRVQTDTIDVADCHRILAEQTGNGALVTFTGIVRDYNTTGSIEGITLESYDPMTQNALSALCNRAHERFSIGQVVLIHRVGFIANHELIVFVGVASAHRQAAFDAAQFIMDRLKADVPLWKKEHLCDGTAHWVAAKKSDEDAAQQWGVDP